MQVDVTVCVAVMIIVVEDVVVNSCVKVTVVGCSVVVVVVGVMNVDVLPGCVWLTVIVVTTGCITV